MEQYKEDGGLVDNKTLKLPRVFEILQEIEERAQAAAARIIKERGVQTCLKDII